MLFDIFFSLSISFLDEGLNLSHVADLLEDAEDTVLGQSLIHWTGSVVVISF